MLLLDYLHTPSYFHLQRMGIEIKVPTSIRLISTIYRTKLKKKPTTTVHQCKCNIWILQCCIELVKIVLLLQYSHNLKMAYDGTESNQEQISYVKFIRQIQPCIITSLRWLERNEKKL